MFLSVIILAAGQGTRMKSALPKVMHKLSGIPMVEHVYNRACELNADSINIVYGHGGERLRKSCGHFSANWAEQKEQLGTAHAVQQASPSLNDEGIALILYGDVPLIKSATLKELMFDIKDNNVALLTVDLEDPTGYGRIVRVDGEVKAIVEHKDATEAQKNITEVNTGILAVRAGYLNNCLNRIDNKNVQGEYYLTDLIEIAVNDGNKITTTQPENSYEVEGVNDRMQLAKLERINQSEIVNVLMSEGATLADPMRTDVRGDLSVGNDVYIDINCVFEGEVNLGSGVQVGAGCVISNSTIACDSIIKPYSIIENALIDKNVEVGPFARLRPGAELKERCKVGNFVEVKNTILGINSKASHLSYLGDSEIGENVNIGAGTITCNYDGVNKHKTIIEDDVFVGSDTQFIAPVKVGKGATIGAGATITSDVEEGVLAISRAPQKSIKGWKRPKKN